MHESGNHPVLPRIRWRQEVRLIRENGDSIPAISDSLLNGGLSVLLDHNVLTGEQLIVDSVLPNHQSHRLEPVRMRCRVTYVVALTHPVDTLRAGLAIEQIDTRHRERLLRFAREQIRRQRRPATADGSTSY